MPPKPVVVFGGSGQIGRVLLPRLIEAGCDVLALSRSGPWPAIAGVDWRAACLPDSVPALPASSVLISLGPLDLFVAWLQRQSTPGTRRIIAISSMSAVSKRNAALAAERELAARLQAAECGLLEHCARFDLGWSVFRPTMIYGSGMDRTVTAIMAFAQRWRLMPLPRAHGLRQPVHVGDLADAVLVAATRAQSADQCFEIGGAERIPVQAMFARMRANTARRTLAIPIPRSVIRACRHLASHSSLAARISRLEHDLTADNSALQKVLGVHPRAFAPRPCAGRAPP